MPKLITVIVALGLASFAGAAVAQDETPPASAPAEAETAGEGSSAAPATGSEAPTDNAADASPETASESVDAETQATAPSETPSETPADTAAPSTQPAPSSADAGSATSEPEATVGDAPAAPGAALAASGPSAEAMERRIVAYVATGVAAAALVTGITLGTLALNKHACLSDVVACNQGAAEPILGEAFLEQKAEVETMSLLADMSYVVAAAATIVAITGYIRGYFLTEEDAEVTP